MTNVYLLLQIISLFLTCSSLLNPLLFHKVLGTQSVNTREALNFVKYYSSLHYKRYVNIFQLRSIIKICENIYTRVECIASPSQVSPYTTVPSSWDVLIDFQNILFGSNQASSANFSSYQPIPPVYLHCTQPAWSFCTQTNM